jgi:hypothetical protein
MPGARCARSRAWCVVNTRVSHHGHTGITRHSPRNGFNGYFVLSRVTGLSCHPRRRSFLHQLDASVGASGPHDFAVCKPALSSAAPPASIASRPAFVTIASRPSDGTGPNRYISVSTKPSSEISENQKLAGRAAFRAADRGLTLMVRRRACAVSNHRGPVSLILRDARKSAPQDEASHPGSNS